MSDEYDLLIKLQKKLTKLNKIYASLLDSKEEEEKKEVKEVKEVKKEASEKCKHIYKSGKSCIKDPVENGLCVTHKPKTINKSQVVKFIKETEESN